jgi:hypothetical protein
MAIGEFVDPDRVTPAADSVRGRSLLATSAEDVGYERKKSSLFFTLQRSESRTMSVRTLADGPFWTMHLSGPSLLQNTMSASKTLKIELIQSAKDYSHET